MPSETPSFPPCCPQPFAIPATFRYSRENGNLEPQIFRRLLNIAAVPMVWIPACAGMTIWKLPETQKQLKPNTLDSRFRGNDGGGKMPSETRNGFRRHFCLNIQTVGGLPITQSFPPQNADCGENQDFDNAHNEARLPPFAHIDVV